MANAARVYFDYESREIREKGIFFGERALQSATTSYLEPYIVERNHQGLANRLIAPGAEVGRTTGSIAFRERLGGLLRYYYREAA